MCSFLSGMNGLSLPSEVRFNHACRSQAAKIRAELGGGCKVFPGGTTCGAALLGLILCGCAVGKDALNKMSAEERAFAEKVHQAQRGIHRNNRSWRAFVYEPLNDR